MTTATHSHANTFLQWLQDSTISIGDLAFQMGVGHVDPPEVLNSPTRRWGWFAELLSNREWGITTYVPGLADICAATAHLCRQTTSPAYTGNLAGQWDVIATRIVAVRRSHHGTGEPEALDMLADLVADGADHCRGSEASGFEALLAYILTLRRIHGPAARETLLWATESAVERTSPLEQSAAP